MKLSEEGLRQLIKEELALVADVNEEEEGSEVTRDAIESNLHDEKIIRFFEGLESGTLTEEQIDSEIQQMDEGKVSTLIPRLAGFMFKSKMVAKLMGKIAVNPRYSAQLLILIIKNMGLEPEKTLLPAIIARGREAEDAAETGFDAEAEGAGEETEQGPPVQEEIVNKVIEEIFKKKQ